MTKWVATIKDDGIVYKAKIDGYNAYIDEYHGQYTIRTDTIAFNCIFDSFNDAANTLEQELDRKASFLKKN